MGPSWGLGDNVLTTGALAEARRLFPNARITYCAPAQLFLPLKNDPAIDDFIGYDSADKSATHWTLRSKLTFIAELRRRKYDCAILLRRSFEAAFLSLLAGVPRRVGYDSDSRGFILTHSIHEGDILKHTHWCPYYVKPVHAAAGFHGQWDMRMHLYASREEAERAKKRKACIAPRGPLIGINPGSAHENKRYPTAAIAAVCEMLLKKNCTVVVLGGTEDIEFAKEIMTAIPKKLRAKAHAFPGTMGLGEFIAFVGLCDVFVSGDSFPMHVASAMQVPIVALYGSQNPDLTGPFGVKNTVIRADLSCIPCGKLGECSRGDIACMKEIKPRTVADAVLAFAGKRTVKQKKPVP